VPIRVEVDPARLRPVEIMRAVGDATKAREVLGWSASVDFQAVV